jgi:hypothetical protein
MSDEKGSIPIEIKLRNRKRLDSLQEHTETRFPLSGHFRPRVHKQTHLEKQKCSWDSCLLSHKASKP